MRSNEQPYYRTHNRCLSRGFHVILSEAKNPVKLEAQLQAAKTPDPGFQTPAPSGQIPRSLGMTLRASLGVRGAKPAGGAFLGGRRLAVARWVGRKNVPLQGWA